MPIRPPKQCDTPNCLSAAIAGSIYCAQHQTKDSAGNRVRRTFPAKRRGPRRVHVPEVRIVNCENPAAIDKALEDTEDLSSVQIPPAK